MNPYVLTHLGDRELRCSLKAAVSGENASIAIVVAHIAETDARKLYVPDGYSSMHAYCVEELNFTDDAAFKRIQVARVARRFPVIFTALADGRIHLTGMSILAPHFTAENVVSLLEAATRKSKMAIQALIAERYPRTELLPLVHMRPAQLAPAQVDETISEQFGPGVGQLAPAQVVDSTPAPAETRALQIAPAQVVVPCAKLTPSAADRFELFLSIGRRAHDKLRYAQELLSHSVPSGDIAEVLERALDALIDRTEKRKFAKTSNPRRPRARLSTNPRHIPAQVKHAVWQRDGGRCTFVSDSGHRCSTRKLLEFDHIDPVARGGQATVEGIRLRCRAHNQYAAECTFGAGFMDEKREAARRTSQVRARMSAATESPEATDPLTRDLAAALKQLGFRADQVRSATAYCATLGLATLEECVRAALRYLCPKPRVHGRVGTSLAAPA